MKKLFFSLILIGSMLASVGSVFAAGYGTVDRDQQRLRDGSCQVAYDRDQLKLRDGSCKTA